MKGINYILAFIMLLTVIITCLNNVNAEGSKITIKNVVKIDGNNKNSLIFAGIDTKYGSTISNMGDIDGDGVTDIAVGAYKNRGKGSVYIHFLNIDGTLKSTIRLDENTPNGAKFDLGSDYGIKVKNIGDMDGNGVNDIAVKSNNTTYIHYLYNDASIKKTAISTKEINFYTKVYSNGLTVEFIGDLDLNGTNDLLIGRPKDGGSVSIYYLNGNNNFYIKPINKNIYSTNNSTKEENNNSTKEPKTQKESTIKTTQNTINNNSIKIHGFLYPDSRYRGLDDAQKYKPDVLRAEFHRINDDGELILMDEYEWGYGGYSKETIRILKNTSNKIYTTLSGMKPAVTAFAEIPNRSNEIVNSLIDFVVENDITGVDVDIEQLGAWTIEEKDAYISFLYNLGTGLHKKGKKLIVDIPAVSSNDEAGWYNLKYSDFSKNGIKDAVDYYTIMTYDYMFDQGIGEPVQPLEWVGKVIDYSRANLDNDKIIIGLNSYGYIGINSLHNPTNITYNQAQSLSKFDTAVRDPSSGEMYWNDGIFHHRYVDTQGMNIKKDYIISKGINKIAVWHLGGNNWFY